MCVCVGGGGGGVEGEERVLFPTCMIICIDYNVETLKLKREEVEIHARTNEDCILWIDLKKGAATFHNFVHNIIMR